MQFSHRFCALVLLTQWAAVDVSRVPHDPYLKSVPAITYSDYLSEHALISPPTNPILLDVSIRLSECARWMHWYIWHSQSVYNEVDPNFEIAVAAGLIQSGCRATVGPNLLVYSPYILQRISGMVTTGILEHSLLYSMSSLQTLTDKSSHIDESVKELDRRFSSIGLILSDYDRIRVKRQNGFRWLQQLKEDLERQTNDTTALRRLIKSRSYFALLSRLLTLLKSVKIERNDFRYGMHMGPVKARFESLLLGSSNIVSGVSDQISRTALAIDCWQHTMSVVTDQESMYISLQEEQERINYSKVNSFLNLQANAQSMQFHREVVDFVSSKLSLTNQPTY